MMSGFNITALLTGITGIFGGIFTLLDIIYIRDAAIPWYLYLICLLQLAGSIGTFFVPRKIQTFNENTIIIFFVVMALLSVTNVLVFLTLVNFVPAILFIVLAVFIKKKIGFQ